MERKKMIQLGIIKPSGEDDVIGESDMPSEDDFPGEDDMPSDDDIAAAKQYD